MRSGAKGLLQVRRTILTNLQQTAGQSRIARLAYTVKSFANRFRYGFAHVLSSQCSQIPGKFVRLLIFYVKAHLLTILPSTSTILPANSAAFKSTAFAHDHATSAVIS